jgi:hypothetical protein
MSELFRCDGIQVALKCASVSQSGQTTATTRALALSGSSNALATLLQEQLKDIIIISRGGLTRQIIMCYILWQGDR